MEVSSWHDFGDITDFVMSGDHDWVLLVMLPATVTLMFGGLLLAAPMYIAWLTAKRASALRGITAKLEGQ